MKKLIPLVALSFLAACSTSAPQTPNLGPHTIAEAKVSSGKSKGAQAEVVFERTEKGLKVTTNATGLPPHSTHGFHIHENGKCEGNFESAGGHLNPGMHHHDKPQQKQRHLGDLGNLQTDAYGKASKELFLDDLSESDINKLMGKSVIIHDKADDYKTQPTGNSGNRIACGVIEHI